MLLLGGLLLAADIAAAAPLTEADAVRRGLARAEIQTLLETRRREAEGNARAAGRWANPEIEYSRESLDLPGGELTETSLWIRQRLNVVGVHGLERDAAAALKVAAGARAEIERRDIAADIRRLYYRALAAQAQLRTARRWEARLDQLAGSVAERVAAGDASRYDLLRIEREFALLRGEVLGRQAAAESARDRLFSLIGGQPGSLSGRVMPPAVEESTVDDVIADHPLLVALDAEAN
ncbi:MAG: TolC family protein, partial [Gammaproteobacteria bacterium]|nr:TolC family protein [Gammaproteobacteria bacterium]